MKNSDLAVSLEYVAEDSTFTNDLETLANIPPDSGAKFAREALGCAFLLGFLEGLDDVGMTYDNDPDSPRSVAYDTGREMRRALQNKLLAE